MSFKAYAINGTIEVDSFYNLDGEWFAEIPLTDDAGSDFIAYKALPNAIKINGTVLVKSAFHSDRHIAYFKSSKPVAVSVD